MLPPSLSVYE